VPPGVYNVKAERTGFKIATTQNIEVQVQQVVRLDFSLEVGQVNESVSVSGVADLLQADNSTVGTVIENKGIAELPLNGRQYLNLVALSPNTNTLSPSSGQAGSRQGGDRASQSISAAGQRIMYDYFTLDRINNTDPNFNTYVVLPSIDALQEFKVVWTQTPAVCSNGVLNDRLRKTEYTDFAPRIGVAWSPNSRWVVRTGFGMFYNQDIGNAIFDLARNIAGRIRINSAVGTPTIGWANAAPGGNGSKAQLPPPYAFVAAYSHHTPYTMEYLMNVQRQIGSSWSVEAGYLGSVSRHLYGFQNANSAIPGTTGSALSRTPFADYGVIQLVADGGVGNYNAASLKVTRRFSAGLSLISSYTLAKSIDDTSGIRVQGYDTLFPQNSDCIECERGLSPFDTRHRLVNSVIYDLPVGKGRPLDVKNGFANAIVGGWQIGGIWTVQSGLPQTIMIGGVDRSGTGNGYDRPIATLASNGYAANQTPSRWYDPAAFVEAPAGTYGNVGRDTMITPGIFGLDFDAHKEFVMPFRETHRLQFHFEAFNVLNHPVWGAPNGNILAGSAFPGQPGTAAHQGFGVISGTALPMRQLQLALKYIF
jgi:hypothetical protein